MKKLRKTYCIIPAGGTGTRMGLPFPKQLLPFRGKALIEHTIQLFKGIADDIVIPVPPSSISQFKELLGNHAQIIHGGTTRYHSVRNGFAALPELDDQDLIVIHDAARPFLDPETLTRALNLTDKKGAVIYATPATDTIKEVNETSTITKTLDRNRIYLAQTPQIFQAGILKKCYKIYGAEKGLPVDSPTDEAAMVEACGFPVCIFPSTPKNKKITLREDIDLLDLPPIRIGHGYDVHRFDPKRPLILCGVELPTGPGLLGHSDADVALHALMDALLGSCGLGDIGQHFPDTDVTYRGISSALLLEEVLSKLKKHDAVLINVDLTILAQIPVLAPFMTEMRENLANLLGLPADRVNIKATTTEGLGFIGEKHGMAAHCVALVSKS